MKGGSENSLSLLVFVDPKRPGQRAVSLAPKTPKIGVNDAHLDPERPRVRRQLLPKLILQLLWETSLQLETKTRHSS